MSFDFPNAQVPALLPLVGSFDPGDIRDELKRIALDLFRDHLGEAAFDANVLGMAHLGTFDLVRRCVQADGLSLLHSDTEEAATRYLYRAWKSADTQGRGLHFLRTYVQLLFPNQADICQLWHDSRFPYGNAFIRNEPRTILTHFLSEEGLRVDGSWKVGALIETPYTHQPDDAFLWLTSRIQIRLGLEYVIGAYADGQSTVRHLYAVIGSIIPARLVPSFLFWLRFELFARPSLQYRLAMAKDVAMRYPWCGRVITDNPDRRWSLGRDGELVRLAQPFGTFRLGERRGGLSVWHLTNCRIVAPMTARLHSAASVYRAPMVGEPWRRLDGAWALSRRQPNVFGRARCTKLATVTQPQSLVTRLAEQIRLEYPFTPRRLDRVCTLDGHWRVGPWAPALGSAVFGKRLDGFRLGRVPSILAASTRTAKRATVIYAAPRQLEGQPLNGWPLGALRAPETIMRVRGHYTPAPLAQPDSAQRVQQDIAIAYPGNPRRLGRWQTLNDRWRLMPGLTLPHRVGGSALDGFLLRRDAALPSIRCE